MNYNTKKHKIAYRLIALDLSILLTIALCIPMSMAADATDLPGAVSGEPIKPVSDIAEFKTALDSAGGSSTGGSIIDITTPIGGGSTEDNESSGSIKPGDKESTGSGAKPGVGGSTISSDIGGGSTSGSNTGSGSTGSEHSEDDIIIFEIIEPIHDWRVKPSVTGSINLSANYHIPALERPFIDEHLAYIVGYPDGTVCPERNITRAEVATVFFRLLLDEMRTSNWTQTNSFSDINENSWYNNAASVMSNMEIIKGYPDGAFKPNDAITRAELAVIVARFAAKMHMSLSNDLQISDIIGLRAVGDVEYAAAIGLANGCPDGTPQPNQPITRAEFMTLVNRMLKREPETSDDLLDNDMIKWADVKDPDVWYYLAVQEATNSHETRSKDKRASGLQFEYEFWVKTLNNRDWAVLEK